jgi:hypothetical protein
MSYTTSVARFGSGGMMVVGRGVRRVGHRMVSETSDVLAVMPWYTVHNGGVFISQLRASAFFLYDSGMTLTRKP